MPPGYQFQEHNWKQQHHHLQSLTQSQELSVTWQVRTAGICMLSQLWHLDVSAVLGGIFDVSCLLLKPWESECGRKYWGEGSSSWVATLGHRKPDKNLRLQVRHELHWNNNMIINSCALITAYNIENLFFIVVSPPRPPSSPSQRCKVYTQKGVMPSTPPPSSHSLAQDGQATEALTSDSNY